MPSAPPSFGAQPYWDARFTKNTLPFDWLSSPTTLDAPIVQALGRSNEAEPQILHVGCGTSLLSFHLRSHVRSARQIHNIDYSSVAVELGQKRERESYHARRRDDERAEADADVEAPTSFMRWQTADMLNHASLLHVCKLGAYAVIVDKSTCDAIACADHVYIPRPYPVDLCSNHYDAVNLDVQGNDSHDRIHPLYILAVNLALVAKAGARWIALSYSAERFPWCDGTSWSPPRGIPDPKVLWRLAEQCEMEGGARQSNEESEGGSVTHKPRPSNWVYVLERTDVLLFVRGGHI